MNWALVLLTAAGLQTVGVYDQQDVCERAASSWRKQDVKAGCIQQQSPEQAVAQMQRILKSMMQEVDNRSRPVL